MIRAVFKSTILPELAFNHAMPGYPLAHYDPKHAVHYLRYLYQVNKQVIKYSAQRAMTKAN